MSDDKPFNPFYIGPHPSLACAPTETATVNQSNEAAKEEEQKSQSTADAVNCEENPSCKGGEATDTNKDNGIAPPN